MTQNNADFFYYIAHKVMKYQKEIILLKSPGNDITFSSTMACANAYLP